MYEFDKQFVTETIGALNFVYRSIISLNAPDRGKTPVPRPKN